MGSRPHIRAGVLENYRRTVDRFGGEPDRLLQRAGISVDALAISGTYITYASYLELHRLTAEELACPHFGLEMTRVASVETLGMTGYIMLQAANVEEAWRSLSRFYKAHDTFGTVGFATSGSQANMSYQLPRTDLPGSRGAFDAAAGISINIMRQLCGNEWRPNSLGLPFPAPEDLSVYRHLGAERLEFNRPCYEMFFDTSWLELPVESSNPEMHSILDRYFSSLEPERRGNSRERVEKLIRGLLPLGECSLERVASMLALSPRGLQARLAAEHSSFQLLLEHVRREISIHHLTCGDMQLTQLAMILGYSELSAFSRSFKRWFGLSPREYLRQRPLPG